MTRERVCPIRSGGIIDENCIVERCAWWMVQAEFCALVSIALDLSRMLMEMKSK